MAEIMNIESLERLKDFSSWSNKGVVGRKGSPDDEYYTSYEDIKRELEEYRDKFKGKIVYCPCDNPHYSQFWQFFHKNFSNLGLKGLICTFINTELSPGAEDSYAYLYDEHVRAAAIEKEVANRYEIYKSGSTVGTRGAKIKDELRNHLLSEGYDPDVIETNLGRGVICCTAGCSQTLHSDAEIREQLKRRDSATLSAEERDFLASDNDYSAGDFRSFDVRRYFMAADIIVTNPPFSLFSELLSLVNSFRKDFILVGTKLKFSGVDLALDLMMQGRLYAGIHKQSEFNGFVKPLITTDANGNTIRTVEPATNVRNQCRWFISWPVKHNKYVFTHTYNSDKYIKYDNYDAIEVTECSAIPEDYTGVMGLPSTFLSDGWYNSEQFELIGKAHSADRCGLKTKKYSTEATKNALVYKIDKSTGEKVATYGIASMNSCAIIHNADGSYEAKSNRVFIRIRRENNDSSIGQ